MTNSKRKSFYISSIPLNVSKEYQYNGFYFGVYSECFCFDNESSSILISLDEVCSTVDSSRLKSNYIIVENNRLRIVGSCMNTQAVYYICVPERDIFVVFNDLFIAREILKSLDLEAEYDPDIKGNDLSFFKNLNRLRHGEEISVYFENGKLAVEIFNSTDILGQAPENYSLEAAREKFYEVLFNATKELTCGEDEVYISLSGGIDSGTIAYILKQLGKKINAYTLGTDWGNEYEEAQETADFLGIKLQRIHLWKDEIISEVPSVIRFFGFKDSVQIEIALVAYCLYKKLNSQQKGNMTFVTGYGSDLLNAGIFSKFEHYQELTDELLRGLRKTQISNEFSNLAALNLGVRNIHPFWHPDVIREALRVPVQYKVREGKDKYFFRSMMDGRLPSSVAWRTKRAAHQGSGLNAHLKEALEKKIRENDNSKISYERILENIHKDIFFHGVYPWEKGKLN